ncbi:pyridoxal phosphate-dependent aminotransferase [Alphaproteobacteria bacterium]|nr:pyridoxal phosphate-dependent aminotransferase [Alphaproteobacteria bacterium]
MVNLSLGEPSAILPHELKKMLADKIFNTRFGYTESIGITNLRRAIARHYKTKYKIEISYKNIAVTAGASAGIFMSLITFFDTGSIIAVSNPGYPCYRNIINTLGLKTYLIPTDKENNFQLTPKLIENLPKNISGLIISSPSNPCGSIIPDLKMQEISNICTQKKIKIISDEIYHGISYEYNDLDTVFKFNKNSIIVNSFSKYFLMTGYRLGWVLANDKIIEKIKNLSMNFYLSPSSISQCVGEEVFNYYDYFDKIIVGYQSNRDFLIKEMESMGLKNFIFPQGAFYLYVDISNVHANSYDFCKSMVEDIGVTCAPGIDFDEKNGKSFIRLSYSCKKTDLAKALKLMKSWI